MKQSWLQYILYKFVQVHAINLIRHFFWCWSIIIIWYILPLYLHWETIEFCRYASLQDIYIYIYIFQDKSVIVHAEGTWHASRICGFSECSTTLLSQHHYQYTTTKTAQSLPHHRYTTTSTTLPVHPYHYHYTITTTPLHHAAPLPHLFIPNSIHS